MAWKTVNAPEAVLLPSGNMPKLRRPSVRSLLALGDKLPTPIKNMVAGEIFGKPAAQKQASGDDASSFLIVIEAYARAAFVEPRIVDSNPDGETTITLDMIDDQDLFFIFSWATGSGIPESDIEQVKSFRVGEGVPPENVGLVQDEQHVPPEAIGAAGD